MDEQNLNNTTSKKLNISKYELDDALRTAQLIEKR